MKRMTRLKSAFICLALLAAPLYFFPVFAESTPEKSLPSVPGDHLQLGTVDFPTSTKSPLAQAHFILGLKYLHNFMYPLAVKEFTLAKQSDPTFAMSYWGIAMSYYWPIWNYKDTKDASVVLQQLHVLKNISTSPLEHDFLEALEILYGPSSSLEDEKKYLQAMKKIYQKYPNNVDVASFYALVLISYALNTDNDESNGLLQEARNILMSSVKTHPNHPGVIHYITHVDDVSDSRILKDGLTVMPNVLTYLKDSSHVLHMPAHLYVRLGMWSEAAQANILSVQASDKMCRFIESQDSAGQWSLAKRDACDADNKYHSLEWLQHEYLEMGQYEKAAELLKQMQQVASIENQPMYDAWAYRMQARQIIYTSDWSPLQSLPKPIKKEESHLFYAAQSECDLLLTSGLRAAHNQQTNFFPLINQRYQEIITLLEQQIKKNQTGEVFKIDCNINQAMVQAAKAAYIDKKPDAALHILEQKLSDQQKSVASRSFAGGMPVQELYAEILLQKPTKPNVMKAIHLYQEELKYFPNHTSAISGLKHAESLLNKIK